MIRLIHKEPVEFEHTTGSSAGTVCTMIKVGRDAQGLEQSDHSAVGLKKKLRRVSSIGSHSWMKAAGTRSNGLFSFHGVFVTREYQTPARILLAQKLNA